MKVIGLGLTHEDMSRIAAAVGAMAISVMENAESFEDFKEGAELARLNQKLLRAMSEMAKDGMGESEHGDACES